MNVVDVRVTWQDYPDPDDLAILVYFSGCEHNCKNCHNAELQDYTVGTQTHVDELWDYLYDTCYRNKTNKVVFQGGDPLYKTNIKGVKSFLKRNAEEKVFDVCLYTGYPVSFAKSHNLNGFKFLKCGLYDEQLKQPSEKTDDKLSLGSSNQELFDSNYNLLSRYGVYWFK
jgi:anaerobic ribonucleoside-triphosphate reductase activating protein